MKRKTLKIQAPAYDQYQQTQKLGGSHYGIRSAISREEKEDLALEMVAGGVVFEEELGICFDAVNADVVHFFLRLMHYTDLNLEAFDNEEGQYQIFNACRACEAYGHVLAETREDWHDVMDIYYALHEVLTRSFEHKHALSYRLSSILGDFMSPEDMDRTLSEAHDVNHFLIDALDAMKDKDTVGKKVGGNIISLAKKDGGKLPN